MVAPITLHDTAFIGAQRLKVTSLGGLVAGDHTLAHVQVAPALIDVLDLPYRPHDVVVEGNDAWAVGHGFVTRIGLVPLSLVVTTPVTTIGSWIVRANSRLIVPGMRGGLLVLNDSGVIVSDCAFGRSIVAAGSLGDQVVVVLNGGEVRLLDVVGDHLAEISRLYVPHGSYTYRVLSDDVATVHLLTVHRSEVIELDYSVPTAPVVASWTVRDAIPISPLYTRHSHLFPIDYAYDDVIDAPTGLMALSSQGIVQCFETITAMAATVSAAPAIGFTPLVTTFSAVVTGGVAPYSYVWQFDDGTKSRAAAPTRTFAAAGSHAVTVFITDAAGQVIRRTLSVLASQPIFDVDYVVTPSGADRAGHFSTTVAGPVGHPNWTYDALATVNLQGFTVMCWFTGAVLNNPFLSLLHFSGAENGMAVGIQIAVPAGVYSIRFQPGAFPHSVPEPLVAGVAYHVACVVHADRTSSLYFNGVLVGAGVTMTTMPATFALNRITTTGGALANTDRLKVYPVELSAAAILAEALRP